MTTPSGALSRDQREFRLLEALKNLPEESQTALRLRYVEGLPSKEIASQLGRTDGATRVLLTRSLARLQELLRHDSEFRQLHQSAPHAVWVRFAERARRRGLKKRNKKQRPGDQ